MVFRSQPLIFAYCLTGAVIGACIIYLDEFWQIISENIGIPVILFGVVGAAITSLRIPGNLLAYRLKEKLSFSHILTCVIALSALGYAMIFFLGNMYCLAPMALLFLITGVVDPLVAGYLHHRIPSHIRATVESLSSLGLRAVSIGVGLVFGYVSKRLSIFAGFLSLSVVCFGYLILFYVMEKRLSRGDKASE